MFGAKSRVQELGKGGGSVLETLRGGPMAPGSPGPDPSPQDGLSTSSWRPLASPDSWWDTAGRMPCGGPSPGLSLSPVLLCGDDLQEMRL